MSDEKITPLFGQGQSAAAPAAASNPPAKTYNIKMKDGTYFEDMEGYLAINGLFVCLTDTPNDPMKINFYALMEDTLFIVESDEVVTDEQEALPF